MDEIFSMINGTGHHLMQSRAGLVCPHCSLPGLIVTNVSNRDELRLESNTACMHIPHTFHGQRSNFVSVRHIEFGPKALLGQKITVTASIANYTIDPFRPRIPPPRTLN